MHYLTTQQTPDHMIYESEDYIEISNHIFTNESITWEIGVQPKLSTYEPMLSLDCEDPDLLFYSPEQQYNTSPEKQAMIQNVEHCNNTEKSELADHDVIINRIPLPDRHFKNQNISKEVKIQKPWFYEEIQWINESKRYTTTNRNEKTMVKVPNVYTKKSNDFDSYITKFTFL